MSLQQIKKNKCFSGWHEQYRHHSATLQCEMNFSIYLPPQHAENKPSPVLYWLSGLTCNHENFMQKAGALQWAAHYGITLVAPDTSPRGDEVADDKEEAYDLGLGAGFYVNATEDPWKKHYQMFDYISEELPLLIGKHFPVTDKAAIFGHSMGGHGALIIALRNTCTLLQRFCI